MKTYKDDVIAEAAARACEAVANDRMAGNGRGEPHGFLLTTGLNKAGRCRASDLAHEAFIRVDRGEAGDDFPNGHHYGYEWAEAAAWIRSGWRKPGDECDFE